MLRSADDTRATLISLRDFPPPTIQYSVIYTQSNIYRSLHYSLAAYICKTAAKVDPPRKLQGKTPLGSRTSVSAAQKLTRSRGEGVFTYIHIGRCRRQRWWHFRQAPLHVCSARKKWHYAPRWSSAYSGRASWLVSRPRWSHRNWRNPEEKEREREISV